MPSDSATFSFTAPTRQGSGYTKASVFQPRQVNYLSSSACSGTGLYRSGHKTRVYAAIKAVK